MRPGEILAGIQIVVSDRVNRLTGQILDERGGPLADGTAIVFADDPEKWTLDSRFVRGARPDQQGRFEIRGLPPGEYRAVALDYVEDGLWNDPEYLRDLRDIAQRFTIGETGIHSIGLRLAAP
jgi:hypothetical protein